MKHETGPNESIGAGSSADCSMSFITAVCGALGPKGGYVVIPDGCRTPLIARDGLTLARRIKTAGAASPSIDEAVRAAGICTARNVNDGAKTAMIIAQSILHASKVKHAGDLEPNLIQGLMLGLNAARAAVQAARRRCASHREVEYVAETATGGDAALGNLIASAIRQTGPYGAVVLEAWGSRTDTISISRGIELPCGLAPSATPGSAVKEITLENPDVAVVSGCVTQPEQLSGVLNAVALSQRPLIVFVADTDQYIESLFQMNSQQGSLNSCVVKAPLAGEQQRAVLDDIAVLTGAAVLSVPDTPARLDGRVARLGRARRITVSRSRTTIVGAEGDAGQVAARIRRLYAQIREGHAVHADHFIRERIGRLAGGVATVRIGATNTTALHEKMARASSALYSARAALANGVVAGGGLALLQTILAIEAVRCEDRGINAGLDLLTEAIAAPFFHIVRNAGADPERALQHLRNEGCHVGFDARSCKYVDHVQAGILDPVSVVLEALTQGVEAAIGCLRTEEEPRVGMGQTYTSTLFAPLIRPAPASHQTPPRSQ